MTDNEIIKALECCTGIRKLDACANCLACVGNNSCVDILREEALDLINRQKAEIESKDCIILKQKELIDRTQKLVNDTDKNCRTAINIIGRYERQFKSIKAEAVKEFAEKFKKIAVCGKTSVFRFPYYQISMEAFDNLVKEMAGED